MIRRQGPCPPSANPDKTARLLVATSGRSAQPSAVPWVRPATGTARRRRARGFSPRGHKFLCVGTLEERIDEMIERKNEVAEKVVGTGEGWLTKLSTSELKELFALPKEAVAR